MGGGVEGAVLGEGGGEAEVVGRVGWGVFGFVAGGEVDFGEGDSVGGVLWGAGVVGLALVGEEGAVGAAADAIEEAAAEGAVAACGPGVGIIGGVVFMVVGGEAGEAQRGVECFPSYNRPGTAGLEDGLPSAEAIPFDMFVFANRLHLVFHAVFVHLFRFGYFHMLP